MMGTLLAPFGAAYGRVARHRCRQSKPWRAPVPVGCVGNLVVGGTGKTPLCIAIGERLRERGLDLHFLSRGYGGALRGPLRVRPDDHDAEQVGDEPLLLAAAGPTWIARQRPAGIRAAVAAGAEAIVMDDGFQNPSVIKDVAIIVVDGLRGFGNGRVFPAGPLREPVAQGLGRADAVVVVGVDQTGVAERLGDLPVLRARLEPVPEVERRLQNREVVAFAGIGHPEKFFETLRQMGCSIHAAHAFADHHVYRPKELDAILREAQAAAAVPVTTAKDAARLPRGFAERVEVLPVAVVWEDEAAIDRLLAPMLRT